MSTTEGLWRARTHTWLAVEAHYVKALQHAVYCITVTMYTGHEILSLLHITPRLLHVHSVTAFSHDGSKVIVFAFRSGSSLHADMPGVRCAAASKGAVAASITLSAWRRGSLGAKSELKQKACGHLATLSGKGFTSTLAPAPADDEHTFRLLSACH